MSDALIFLLLAGIALVFKWLNTHAANENEGEAPPRLSDPIRRAPPETEEERIRRFLEALGQPANAAPPPPVKPRLAPPQSPPPAAVQEKPAKARRRWAQPLPPLVTVPPPLPPAPAAPESTPAPSQTSPLLVRQEPPLSSMQPITAPLPARSVFPRRNLRDLVIWREILGPPRGLEPLDHLHSR